MYIELLHVDDSMARSFVCTETINNGGFAKVKGLAKLTKAGVDLSGEVYEVDKLTDDVGELFCIIAPSHHRYDERVLSGDTPAMNANKPERGYLLHKGAVIRVEDDNIEGSVAVGDKVTVKATSFKLTKAIEASVNVIGKVIKKGKYHGKDTTIIVFN